LVLSRVRLIRVKLVLVNLNAINDTHRIERCLFLCHETGKMQISKVPPQFKFKVPQKTRFKMGP